MDKKFLVELLETPTAPFREHHVRRLVQHYLRQEGVPFFDDTAGNLVVGVASEEHYRQLLSRTTRVPIRVLMAHMDHPGFHGLRWTPQHKLAVKWFGGAPTQHLVGTRVWIANDGGYCGSGKIETVKIAKGKRPTIDSAVVRIDAPIQEESPTAIFGGFAFQAPVWMKNQLLYTKAADDLVGVFAITQAAIAHEREKASGKEPCFLGLLTRAEEVGFVGAIAHFETNQLQQALRPVALVSLEASRTLPNAEVGKGPIVRLGDAQGPFDPGYTAVLGQIAEGILPNQHQRRLMDGGRCEATPALAFGLRAIGIAVPLGNYHNQGFEGGPGCKKRLGPAPEFIHLKDLEGMVRLCSELISSKWNWIAPWDKLRTQLASSQSQLSSYL